MKSGRVLTAVCLVVAVAGCAVRLGGPSPIDLDAVVMRVASDATAEQTAQLLKERGVEFAILAAGRDTAWFNAVATGAGLTSTRPGAVRGTTYAFMGPKAIGDTTLTLKVTGGGELRVHDALFQIDKNRRIDLMAVQLDTAANLQKSIEALLTYIATDVGHNVSVLLAIEPPRQSQGDSISVIMRALYADTWECTTAGRSGTPPANMPIRLFYGPTVRMKCKSAEPIAEGGLLGHFELPR